MATKNTFFWYSRKCNFLLWQTNTFGRVERRCEKDKVIEGENMGGGTISGLQSEGNENNFGIFLRRTKKGKGSFCLFCSQQQLKIKDVERL